MAKTKEKTITARFKKHWPYYYERIEPKYKGGIPDVLIVDKWDSAIFIEFKVGEITPKGLLKIKDRSSQRIWFRKYTGKAFMLIYMEQTKKHHIIEKCDVPKIKSGITGKTLDELTYFKSVDMKRIVELFL